MKLLVLVGFLSVASCAVFPRFPRIQALVRDADSTEKLYNDTIHLINSTQQVMTRLARTGRLDIDDAWSALNADLESSYQYSNTKATNLVSYLVKEINGLSTQVPNIDSCISLVSYVTNLAYVFTQQFQIVFNTSRYTANTTLENKYTSLMQNIAHVKGLTGTLSNCQLDRDCMVVVADEVEEQNLALLDGLEDISNSIPILHDKVLTTANSSASRTLYVNEEYICNVALIMETCIQSRIDTPIMTTTPSGVQTTTPIPATTVTSAVTTLSTASAPVSSTTAVPSTTINPEKYCTHQAF